MGFLKSMWQSVKRFLRTGAKEVEDPEVILTETREALERGLADMKDRTVAAITRRNALRCKLIAREKLVRDPEADWVDTDIAILLNAREKRPRDPERGSVDPEVAKLRRALETAEKEAAAVKQTIREVEEQVRRRAADRLSRLAGWTPARIQMELNRALSGFHIGDQEQRFERAREHIRRLHKMDGEDPSTA
jgi:phage shock protein A